MTKRRTEAQRLAYNQRQREQRRRRQARDGVDYDEMLERQGGVCAICGAPPTPKAQLCIDHCHDSGKIRGLLCFSCNFAIGLLKDDRSRLEKAIQYLKEHGK